MRGKHLVSVSSVYSHRKFFIMRNILLLAKSPFKYILLDHRYFFPFYFEPQITFFKNA